MNEYMYICIYIYIYTYILEYSYVWVLLGEGPVNTRPHISPAVLRVFPLDHQSENFILN